MTDPYAERRHLIFYGVASLIPDTHMQVTQYGPTNPWRVDHLRADGVLLESHQQPSDWVHEWWVGYQLLSLREWTYERIRLEWIDTVPDDAKPAAIAVYVSGIPYLPPESTLRNQA